MNFMPPARVALEHIGAYCQALHCKLHVMADAAQIAISQPQNNIEACLEYSLCILATACGYVL